MTAWENPTFGAAEPVPGNFEVYPEVPADVEDIASYIDTIKTPEERAAEVLALTRARNAIREMRAEQKQEQERQDAIIEIEETIDALLELLDEIDYPGAEIVNGLRDGVKAEDAQECDLRDIPLWLLDIPDMWGLDKSAWGFGVDGQVYVLWQNGLNRKDKTYKYLYYHPMKLEGLKDILTVRDGLNRFEIPTEDDLLQ